jgi:protein gp37
MHRDKERYGQEPTTVLKSKTAFAKPYQWKEQALVFTCSWSDFFISDADGWRPEAWEIIKNTQHLQYQILTKRPERIKDHLPWDWEDGYPNVWLGVSGENEELTHQRLKVLLQIPAVVRFISAEPLLEEICSDRNCNLIKQLDWVIIGGESGNETGKYRYRPMKQAWVESIISVCKKYNVACFNKQLGTYLSKKLGLKDRHGGNIEEWPKTLQVRQFPEYKGQYESSIIPSIKEDVHGI